MLIIYWITDYILVFHDELDTIQSFQAKLVVREEVKPKFCHVNQVSFAKKCVIEDEFNRLELMGVLERLTSLNGLHQR